MIIKKNTNMISKKNINMKLNLKKNKKNKSESSYYFETETPMVNILLEWRI